jgi:hypothetical protein
MPANSYRIRIVRSGEEFEAEGDKKFVLEMLKRFDSGKPLSGEEPIVTPTAKRKGKGVQFAPSTGKPVSVGEFIRQVGLKKHTDIVLAFGYYLETHSGLKDFAPADINACYYDAKVEPSNTSQMIIQNIKRGFMMASKKAGKGDKRYLLTQTGVDFINAKMNK